MSGEIKLEQSSILASIDEVRMAIHALEKSIFEEISGNNALETVDKFNEIKSEYDALLTTYDALVLKNLESTEDLINSLQTADSEIGEEIRRQFELA